jgi:colanic acid/amylovoran biosynthesis glycosyltransferase
MKRIAIISYNANQYSETFIHNLVDRLPFEVYYLYGGELPKYYFNDQPFLRRDGFRKVMIALKEWMGVDEKKQHEKAVEEYLIRNKIQLVYANYSITALPFMDICERNGIPLIVHFRGWTAYRKTILEKYGPLYPRLFKAK